MNEGVQINTFKNRVIIEPGTYIAKYQVIKLVGQGGYGDVYKVKTPNHQILALKTEYLTAPKKAIDKEMELLKLLDDLSFPQLLDYGTTDKVKYIVMPLYGISISDYRKSLYTKIIPPQYLILIAYEMFLCIEKLHKKGMIHRDIKPSNFLMQFDENHPLCLIDYGLSRKFYNINIGDLNPPNKLPHFGGTKRYTSLRLHDKKDSAPIDDVHSWFYSVVECWRGNLPWSRITSKEDIGKLKRKITAEELCGPMPPQFRQIYTYIHTVGYYDSIDYHKIKILLNEVKTCLESQNSLNWKQLFRSVNQDYQNENVEFPSRKIECCDIA